MPASSADLLVTRPAGEAEAFAAAVEAALPGRFRPVFFPLLRIEEESVPVPLDGVQALLFTSGNGVRAFARAVGLRSLPALCVGEGTAEAARAAGLAATSAGGDVGALARLAAASWQPGAGDYLHVRGRASAGDLAGALAAEGIGVREVVLYDARPAAAVPAPVAEALEAGRIAAVTLFSPRTARLLAAFAAEAAEAGRGWALRRAEAVAISRAAAEPLGHLGFREVHVATTPDQPGMIAALGASAAGRYRS